MRLKDKTALITGGSSGIGLATAKVFIAEGAQVAIMGRDRSKLDAAVQQLGSRAIGIQVDITDVDAMEAVVRTLSEKFGKLDIVFANAGIAGLTPVGQTTLAAFERILRINLTAVFFTIQATVPYLSDGASIIINGSVHSVLGVPAQSAYAASKGGLRAMSRVLASELSPRGIRVNMVSPGGTSTPIWANASLTPEAIAEREKNLTKRIPLNRYGQADDVAKAVLFLASDDASNIQAAEIFVDGGTTGSPWGAPMYQNSEPTTITGASQIK